MQPYRLNNIKWHKKSRQLYLGFSNGHDFELPIEYLRVFSPSAEVQGHGPGQETLVEGKRFVNLSNIEPVGNYAIKLIFDDGHDSGLYTWEYLYNLASNYQQNWKSYLDKLHQAGKQREGQDVHILNLNP
ncbi:MAG TPA: DUF971 domain-containing protein [Aeromonadales bacterium]|nr:DUF971 domain-containing protein [Aeromonadales bacterium]